LVSQELHTYAIRSCSCLVRPIHVFNGKFSCYIQVWGRFLKQNAFPELEKTLTYASSFGYRNIRLNLTQTSQLRSGFASYIAEFCFANRAQTLKSKEQKKCCMYRNKASSKTFCSKDRLQQISTVAEAFSKLNPMPYHGFR
jgi:hypothetical protein